MVEPDTDYYPHVEDILVNEQRTPDEIIKS